MLSANNFFLIYNRVKGMRKQESNLGKASHKRAHFELRPEG